MCAKSNIINFADNGDMRDGFKSKIMIVGDIARWKSLGRLKGDVADCTFVEVDDLNQENLQKIAPDLVLSPLVADGFDVLDVVRSLAAAQFGGRYCAIAVHMPDPAIVLEEISAIAPDLDFDLLVLPQQSEN